MDDMFDDLLDAKEDQLDALYALQSNPGNDELVGKEKKLQAKAAALFKALAPYLGSKGRGQQQTA